MYAPTAVQAPAEVQDTPANARARGPPRSGAAAGLGVGSIDHLEPSNHSASVLPWREPTAAHARRETHDTAASSAPFTDRRSDHRELSQSSNTDPPTTTQKPTDAHDTPSRPGPLGALASIDQLEPFQRSTKPARGPCAFVTQPTATHVRSDTHDTAVSPPRVVPAGSGVPSYVQREPSHRSTRGLWTAPGSGVSDIDPTAKHQLDDLHDTANNSPFWSPGTRTCSSDRLDATASPLPSDNPTITHITTAPAARTPLAAPPRTTPHAPAIGSNVPAPHRRPIGSNTQPNTRRNTHTPPILTTTRADSTRPPIG